MSSPNDPLAWVQRAEEDYTLAIIALRRAQPFPHSACFHAQQAAEKNLKAVLVAQGIVFPRTHDLGMLVTLFPLGAASLPVPLPELQLLAGFAVQARYPGVLTTRQDARRAILIAGRVRRACRRLLGLP
jgi:HEPN domain-containing protein